MGKPIRQAEFVRVFGKYGVCVRQGGGTHLVMRKMIDGKTVQYVAASSKGRHVDDVYVQKARRRFRLTKSDGVTDEDFFS